MSRKYEYDTRIVKTYSERDNFYADRVTAVYNKIGLEFGVKVAQRCNEAIRELSLEGSDLEVLSLFELADGEDLRSAVESLVVSDSE